MASRIEHEDMALASYALIAQSFLQFTEHN